MRPDSAKLLSQSLATGVVLMDNDGLILWCNEAAETLFGASGKNLIGTDASQFFPPLKTWIRGLHADAERASPCSALVRLTPVAGTPKSSVLAVLSVPEPGKLLLEMSEAEQAFTLDRQEQKEGLNDASRVLLRNLAHEIKNPLGGIRGAAQLLETELPDPALREFTGVIIREADREQLTQIFLNLMRNAAQAMEKGIAAGSARITLKTRVARGVVIRRRRCRLAVVIDVIDNGPGIDPSIREKIFYPLVTTRAHGTGLGLSIVRTYAERNGGEVELESEAGGTDFRILLPLATPSEERH